MNKIYFKLFIVMAIALFSVTALAATPAEIFKAKVAAASKVVEQVTPEDVMQMIKDKKEFTVVDVREKNEVEAGKIETSNYIHSPRGLVDIIASKGALPIDKTYVVYCKKGSRGLLAAAALKELGIKNVYNLKGGIHAWMDAGYPITNSLGTFKTVPFELTGCAEQ